MPLFLVLLAIVGAAARADGPAPGGTAVIIGGGLRDDNEQVWQRLVDLAGGRGARFAVIAAGSENPQAAGARAVELLNRRGAEAQFIPLTAAQSDPAGRAAAGDAHWVEVVRAAQGVYFTGGAQERITQALLDAQGAPTPLLTAIWECYRAGGVVAGTSAGAAIMSSTMIRDAPDLLAILKFGARPGRETAPGLGFAGPQLFVDQHFLARGRIGRMLPVMRQAGYRFGIGVDEDTAAVLRGGAVEVIGSSAVLVVDLSRATSRAQGAFNITNARLSYLEQGDRFNFADGSMSPAAEKLAGSALPSRDSAPDSIFFADVLDAGAFSRMLIRLVQSPQQYAVGLAFDPTAARAPDIGFEFRLRKSAQTRAFRTELADRDSYSAEGLLLDVTPIRMRRPLYAPLRPASSAPSATQPASRARGTAAPRSNLSSR